MMVIMVVIVGILSNNHLWLNFNFIANFISLKFVRLESIGIVKYCDQKKHEALIFTY